MFFSYDPGQEILYLHFKDGPARIVKEVGDRVVFEMDGAGEVMGIELRDAREKDLLEHLVKIAVSS
ncbi:DUF2283 domain-containing protein [Candidatus Bathyarchaeota archaeon]|nr:DUF2283 domain-containing protein [Candidatus Bathyarchaeota archaeon]MBS7629177.1 DUF2283 domain-containing protein [Candidatus Bathyarchaeota archaeon]